MTLKISNIECSIKTVPLKRPFITALHKITKIQGLADCKIKLNT